MTVVGSLLRLSCFVVSRLRGGLDEVSNVIALGPQSSVTNYELGILGQPFETSHAKISYMWEMSNIVKNCLVIVLR